MEDPIRKKKDVWKIITEGLNIAGFKFSQNQVEGKWKSLIASHKALRDNKTKTGEKRKTFQYYERNSDILSKRHDINPSFLSGTDVCTSQELKPDTESSTSDTEMKATETGKVNGRKSFSASACRRREKKKVRCIRIRYKISRICSSIGKKAQNREGEEREKTR